MIVIPRTKYADYVKKLKSENAPNKPVPVVNTFSLMLKEAINESDFNISQVAELMGCTHQNFYRMLRRPPGDWRIKEILPLCRLLNIDVSYAFDICLKSSKEFPSGNG